MNEENKKKYLFTNDIDEADFIITNHFYQDYYFKEKDYFSNKHPEFIENYLNDNFTLVYDIESNNVRINSIYIKNK